MAGEDPRYTAFLRTQPCARCGVTYGIEVHHPLWAPTYNPDEPKPPKAIEGARKGKGQKCHDCFCLPLCFATCHIPGIHRGGGHFTGMTVEEREAWEREQIALHRERYAAEAPAPAAAPACAISRRAKPTSSPERERVLEQIETWAGARRLKAEEHQLIHDLVNDLRAEAPGKEF
jgi:hypothetical protein